MLRVPYARLRRAVVFKDQAVGVLVIKVSSPFDWIRHFIADRLVQACSTALKAARAPVRFHVDDENTLNGARQAPGGVGRSRAGQPVSAGGNGARHSARRFRGSRCGRALPGRRKTNEFTGMW